MDVIQKTAEKKIPIEKRILMSKRNALKEAVSYIDPVLELKRKIKEISEDSDLNFSYLWGFVLEHMGLTASELEEEAEADDDEDDASE